MAYVNVKDWSVDQVTDWIKGLDNVILKYAASFLNNGVTGHQLLNLRAEDLEHLGVKTLGHQEIILEAVEHLRNFHYELDKENLQMLALKLSCAANSLFKELLLQDDDAKLTNQITTDVHNVINAVKPLACWMDRSPFAGDKEYNENKYALLQLSSKMATIALRDIFSQQPVRAIRKICEELSKKADDIIQVMSDPMILQPASLDLATLKKKEQDLGFLIMPCNHAIHQICEIKYGYPAHSCNKIENGDEIVQVNYQTVVGWHRKNVMLLIRESPPEIVLTLKKRPRHTKVYGQIYMKPYRLPSKKRGGQNWSRWNDNLPSPRLMPIHDLPPLNIPKLCPTVEEPVDVESTSSSDSEPPDSPIDGEGRMYPLKPRPILQRRNTITGATPTSKRPYLPIEYWELYKTNNSSTHASSYHIDSVMNIEEQFLRDKSVSCNVGLDKRPTTVIGLASRNTSFKKSFKDKTKKKVNFDENNQIGDTSDIKKEENKENSLNVPETNLDEEKSVSVNSLTSLNNEKISFIDEGRDLTDRSSMISDWKNEIVEETIASINMKPVETINENVGQSNPSIKDIIKRFDNQPKVLPRSQVKKPPEVPQKPKPAVPPRSATTKLRGKLDKSHSTPAYDLTEEDATTDNYVVDKTIPLTKLPDVIPTIQETIKEVPREQDAPFTETNYELGIPIVESPSLVKTEISKSQELLLLKDNPVDIIKEDLPPKPPPRNLDVPKPAYPADSPKPQNLLDLAKSQQVTKLEQPPKQIFDFPEPKTPDHKPDLSNTSLDLAIQQTGTIMGKLIYEEKPVKSFEPKIVSTPVTKAKMDFSEAETFQHKSNYEVQKPLTYETQKSLNYELQKSYDAQKVSPTNSIVKAMISSKGKGAKKKNTLTAKRRKVTVNDLSPCDIQGFLYQRLRSKNNIHWTKRWFVLLGNYLYGFKTKEDPRAACLIFLSGYTVAVANEVKSRSHAFKVYHTGTAFYFSADDSETLQSWIELIKPATMHSDSSNSQDGALYSETDESDSEKPKPAFNDKNDSLKKFGSLKKFTSKKNSDNTQSGSTSLDRKWFFKSSSSSSSKNSIPVPTAQFRSYRKIRNETEKSVTTGNFTSHVALFTPPALPASQNVSVPNLTVENIPVKQPEPKNRPQKNLPINNIHASNPSLCNISDFNVPSFPKKSYNKPPNESFHMTLEELMVQENAQKMLNPHVIAEMEKNLTLIKPDVVYGEIPIRHPEKQPEEISKEPLQPSHSRQSSTSSSQNTDKHDTSCFAKQPHTQSRAIKTKTQANRMITK
ncbi:uncharacterized protein LOC109594029 isoform X2 [Aethina tumida]|uniref:uncharacterized protein LOC109594029 isoform X2 n=1 Tax=Aethina tumida TaxID=116153 RepID=UPI00214964B9|nr:uncharacterized protein LOC109594029 isoform X2 [Aethina tumida]